MRSFTPQRRRSPRWIHDANHFRPSTPLAPNTPGKYGSFSATYNGQVYDSRKEALYAAELDVRKRAADPAERVVWWKRQVVVSLDVNGRHICNYICDFLVKYADGHMQYEEVKGFETNVWLIKEKLFRALFPDRILKVIR